MKTSNKILLGILLLGIGYLACAQIALHIKYEQNDFTDPAKYNAFFNDDYQFNKIRHVRIMGLAECNIIFSDSMKLSIQKSNIRYVTFTTQLDTLILNAEYNSTVPANNKINSSPQNVKLFLPAGIDIVAVNSNINIKGSGTQNGRSSYRFDLSACNLFTRYNNGIDSLDRYFDNLTVEAKMNSQVILFRNDHFKIFRIDLDHSFINDYHAQIDTFHVATDSSSVVVISGGNINKLNNNVIIK